MIQRYMPEFTKRAVAYLPAFSSLTIVLLVGIIVAHNAGKLLTCGLLVMLVVMLHNICGLTLGYGIGRLLRLEHKKCVAISIEVGMQNSGLASSLAPFISPPTPSPLSLAPCSAYGTISAER